MQICYEQFINSYPQKWKAANTVNSNARESRIFD